MIRTKVFVLAALLIGLIVVPVSAAPALIAAYNETATPSIGSYWPYSIGWLWESPVNFQLTRIETIFPGGENKTVEIELYDGLPHEGGTLMASASYDQVAGTWGGADLGPISLAAGEQYLIGFANVVNLGVSFTEESGSTVFAVDGTIRYGTTGSPPSSYVTPYFGQSNAILRIYGIPEPSTLALASLLGCMLIRCRRPPK